MTALGVPYDGERPFHRVGNQITDYVTYSQLNGGLKEDGVDQGLKEEDVSSHGLRGGSSKDMATACGGNTLQEFGNWLSDAYKIYQDSSRMKDWTSFARKMAAVGSTNAQALESSD